MIMNIAVIVLVLIVAYTWALRGFFNALLHLVATILGGAIAFAAWEHLSLLLVGIAPTTGFLSFLGGIAWCAGLLIPFAAATILFRVVLDKAIPGNVHAGNTGNLVGGGVCGLAIGILSIGMLVIGVDTTRLGATFTGYKPLWYNPERAQGFGSLKLSDSLWVPVDKLTAKVYSGLSTHAFSSSEPLAEWYPDLQAVVFANRVAPKGTSPRTAYTPDDFKVVGRYSVGPQGGAPVRDLLEYTERGQSAAQPYADVHGEQVASGTLEGFVIRLEASAKDPAAKGAGQVVMSNGQARLVCRDADGTTFNVFPVAMISQAESSDDRLGRWRFDSDELLLASVGGASTVDLALEFVVPAGAEPIGLFVKGVRVELGEDAPKPVRYADAADRYTVVESGSILRGGKAESRPTIDTAKAKTLEGVTSEDLLATNSLGGNLIMHVQVAKRGFTLDADNRIANGFNQMVRSELKDKPQDKKLQVDRFAVSRDQVIVQIVMAGDAPASLLDPSVRLINPDQPLRLVDTNGLSYEAVGYIYEDRSGIEMRYQPSQPLTGTKDLPPISSSRTDQKLKVVFLASLGVKVEYLAIGDTAVLHFDPPLELNQRQN